MIRTQSLPQAYRTRVMSERHEITADAPISKGGEGSGFGAHDLLEAALATCINMAVRMCADERGIPLARVVTRVSLARPQPDIVCFEYALDLEGPLSPEQRQQLERAAQECPVRQSLSKRLEFKEIR